MNDGDSNCANGLRSTNLQRDVPIYATTMADVLFVCGELANVAFTNTVGNYAGSGAKTTDSRRCIRMSLKPRSDALGNSLR